MDQASRAMTQAAASGYDPTKPAGAPVNAGGPVQNTDRELWRSDDGTDVVRLTVDGSIFLGHGGRYIGATPAEWQAFALRHPVGEKDIDQPTEDPRWLRDQLDLAENEASGRWLRMDLVRMLLEHRAELDAARVIMDAAALETYIAEGSGAMIKQGRHA